MNPYIIFRLIPLFLLRLLARFVAFIMMLLPDLSVHNSVSRNLQLAYPSLDNKSRKTLHKNIVNNQALTSVESVKSWAMPPKWSIEQIKNVYNKEVLLAGLNNPNGMLAIVPHLGTWEMMNAWLNQHGSPTIMYKPVKGKVTNEFILQGRERLNATLVPTDASGVKAVFKTLKSGGFSIILPDHVPDPSGGVVVPFFGINTLSSTLASKLASKTKCSLVGLACLRREDGNGFDIHCYDLSENAVYGEDLYSKDMTVATTALNQAMQDIITPISEHYMWGYRRFKHVPNTKNLYKMPAPEFTEVCQQLHQLTSEQKTI